MIASYPRGVAAVERWLGMAGERLTCLLHLMGLAATLAAAKVILSTVGVALFLAKEGPEQLPLFYVLLALVAITLSSAFTGVVDRLPRIRLAQAAFLGTLVGAAALRVPIALDVPGAYHALLASAHIYEIVLDIVFWVVVATYLDAIALKRGAPFLYMALAAGGVAGGALVGALVPFVPAEDLLLALPVLGVIAAAQFGLAGHRLRALDDRHGDDRDDVGGIVDTLALLPRLIGRYPLILLIALNALLLTVLYGLAEYLVFSVYAAEFPDHDELTRFLALIYALIQVVEFAVLYAVSRPLLERAGPLVRNLTFPLSSLACLLGLAFGAKLPAAIAAHVNAEAVSNAIFQPVSNTNYSALPVRFHGRVRTLADGIFYPSGLAVAGVLLLLLQDRLAADQVNFIAIVFALVFVLVNVGVGVLFLPTLVRNLRAGVVHFAELARRFNPLPQPLPEGVRDLLRSADPDARALGLRLAEDLDPTPLLEELRALAPQADRATRRAIAGLLLRARSEAAEPWLDGLLASPDVSSQLVALQAKLARGTVDARRVEPLTRSPHRSVAALATLATLSPRARSADALLRLAHDPDAYGAVIDAIGQSRRADLIDVLVEIIDAAPLERMPQGLATLREAVAGEHAAAGDLARRLAAHSDPSVRTEAIGVLGALARAPGALDELGRALDDPTPRVRRRAAEALAARGDAAIGAAAAKLSAPFTGTVEAAIWTLGRIGSRRARAALRTFLRPTYEQAARNLNWLRRLPAQRDRRAWAALEVALHDHSLRMINAVMSVLAALGEDRLVAQLRRALAATDQRTRANALEALLSLRHRRYVVPILPLLEAVLVVPETSGRGGPAFAGADDLLAEAAAAADPWIRTGTACVAKALGSDRSAVGGAENAPERGDTPSEDDMERVLALKRVPLFRYLPLDTLLAVSRVLERRAYVAGETISRPGGRSDHFWMLESGAVEIVEGGRPAERLVAPAYFGELALADELTPSPGIVALEDGVLLRLHRIVFHDLSRDHPDILMELCRLLARRLRGRRPDADLEC